MKKIVDELRAKTNNVLTGLDSGVFIVALLALFQLTVSPVQVAQMKRHVLDTRV